MKLVAFGLALAVALGGGLAAGAALGPFEDDGRDGSAEMSEAEHGAESGHAPFRARPPVPNEGDEHAD